MNTSRHLVAIRGSITIPCTTNGLPSQVRQTTVSGILALLAFLLATIAGVSPVQAAGTWATLTNQAPNGISFMLLLPDGTVIGQNSTSWYRLTPDTHGSYVNGTWSQINSMHDTRTYYSSQVLSGDKVLVAGGEYGTGGSAGEVYDLMTNSWTRTPAPGQSLLDSISEVLPNGNVIIAPVYPTISGGTIIYNVSTNTWSNGPRLVRGGDADEQSWVKLPDGSILTVDGSTSTTSSSERYIPSSNAWVNDGSVPVALFDSALGEIGPGVLCANGKAIFFGATGHTAIYTPSGNSNPGAWVAGPDIPGGNSMPDAPAAMMVNGKILIATGPINPSGSYNSPTTFFEYDPVANSFTQVDGPTGSTLNSVPYGCSMLDLPDGGVLLTNGGSQLYEYTPGSAAIAAGQPTITGIAHNSDGSYALTGTLLNGISEGAEYGDDRQVNSNYPIVRLISSSGNVYFARSYNWSGTGVMTGATSLTTQFALPLGLPAGTYSVAVIANGNASANTPLTIPFTAGDVAPTVATPAAASPTGTGTTTNLSVLGASANGESTLTYTWTTVSAPSGASTPAFSANGTNAAKNITATFFQGGSYTFNVTITDQSGLSATSSVSITAGTLTTIAMTPAVPNLTAGQTQQFTATANDQFGAAISPQPALTWTVATGGGSVDGNGLYTAPASGTLATVMAASGTVQGTATVYVVDAPWVSADIGAVSAAGLAYSSGGVFTVKSQTGDIAGTADTLHYVYRSMGGDGMMMARVATQQNTAGNAKAGIMIRNSTAAGDTDAMIALMASSGLQFQARTASGGTTTVPGGIKSGVAAPYWVKLVRSGNTITGYYSSNGTTWTQQGSTSLSFGAGAIIGLASDSNNSSSMNTTTFDNVSMFVVPGSLIQANPGTPATVNILAGATAPSGSTLTISGVTQASKGSVVNNGNGTVTYTANSNVYGNDSFVCTVSDGLGDTATATVSVMINGVRVHYKMDEGTGTTTADATGDGFTGAITGATWTSGVEGTGGLAFNGTNSTYVTIPALNLNTNTVTIAAWVKRSGTQAAWSGIVFSRASSSVCGLHFGTANELRYTWNNSQYGWSSGLVPPDGQWTFVALVISPTNATMYMQPLGGSMSTATNNAGNSAGTFNDVTLIGGDTNSSDRYISGAVDEVQVYNTALSATQVAALASAAPMAVVAASATPNPVTGSTTALSALGGSNFYAESTLTYTWSATSIPAGASAPTYSINGTNAAKNTTATFSSTGPYTFQVAIADPSGGVGTSSVSMYVAAPGSVVWSGAGSNGNLSNAANWAGGVAPQSGAQLVLTGTTQTSIVNDYPAGTVFGSLTIQGNNFSISGNQMTLNPSSNPALSSSGANNSISMPIAMTGSTVVNVSSGALSMSGVISGTGPLVKTGAGTLSVSGVNTYTGGTTVSQGTFVHANGNATGAMTAPIALGDTGTGSNPVVLQFTTGVINANNSTTYKPITVNNYGAGTTIYFNEGGAFVNANLNLNKQVTLATTGGGSQFGLMGKITGSGVGAGTDAVIFNAPSGTTFYYTAGYTGSGVNANAFTGNVHITGAGTVDTQNLTYLNAAYINGAIPDAASVTVDSTATWALSWGNESIDALNGTGSIITSAALTIGAGNGSGSYGGVMSSLAALTKTGSGTETLSGSNTYTGTTAITGGTLSVTGSLASGTVTVSGGALAGTGTIGATTVSSGGTLSPGVGGIGTLSFNSKALSLGGATVMEINKAAGTSDKAQGLAGLTYGGTLTINNLGGTLAAGDTFTLFGATSYTGSFVTLNLPPLATGLAWDTSKLATNGSVTVNMKPFGNWQVQAFGANSSNPAIAGPNANPAGDGIVNLLKYAFNSNPLVPFTGELPTVTKSGGNLVLTFLKNDAATDLTYTVLQSTDLATWTTANPTFTTLSDVNGTSTIQATVPISGVPKLLLRLSVTEQ